MLSSASCGQTGYGTFERRSAKDLVIQWTVIGVDPGKDNYPACIITVMLLDARTTCIEATA